MNAGGGVCVGTNGAGNAASASASASALLADPVKLDTLSKSLEAIASVKVNGRLNALCSEGIAVETSYFPSLGNLLTVFGTNVLDMIITSTVRSLRRDNRQIMFDKVKAVFHDGFNVLFEFMDRYARQLEEHPLLSFSANRRLWETVIPGSVCGISSSEQQTRSQHPKEYAETTDDGDADADGDRNGDGEHPTQDESAEDVETQQARDSIGSSSTSCSSAGKKPPKRRAKRGNTTVAAVAIASASASASLPSPPSSSAPLSVTVYSREFRLHVEQLVNLQQCVLTWNSKVRRALDGMQRLSLTTYKDDTRLVNDQAKAQQLLASAVTRWMMIKNVHIIEHRMIHALILRANPELAKTDPVDTAASAGAATPPNAAGASTVTAAAAAAGGAAHL